ncbi:hypothetical protein EPI10_031558 [Gossypium australe]|uniref:Uncharacterized protein n=1 Tax=Gossypium australe TaxID=47621 RepID=A0A5B6X4C7_9ROSI|nr:hypothetical protein EPI10_031558 [Gossypium australe]
MSSTEFGASSIQYFAIHKFFLLLLISLKPNSSPKVTACKHAQASVSSGVEMFKNDKERVFRILRQVNDG